MTFTPLFATTSEVALFCKYDTGKQHNLPVDEFSTMRDIIHEAAESEIKNFLNWQDMDSTNLSADTTGMASVCKMATIQMVSNYFLNQRQQQMGRVIDMGDRVVKLPEIIILSDDIKRKLQPYRIHCFGIVDRTDEEEEDE